MEGELLLYQERQLLSRAAAARLLHALADKILAGEFALGEHPVVLPEQVNAKAEFDDEGDGSFELEMEVHWDAWDKMPGSVIG
jgi:amphi-Trp domain-containing protein